LKGDCPAATSREQFNKRAIHDPGLREETKVNAHNCVKHFWKNHKEKMKRLMLEAQVIAGSYPQEFRRVTLLHWAKTSSLAQGELPVRFSLVSREDFRIPRPYSNSH